MIDIKKMDNGRISIAMDKQDFIFILSYLGVANEISDETISGDSKNNSWHIYHEMTEWGRRNNLFGYDSTLYLNGYSLVRN